MSQCMSHRMTVIKQGTTPTSGCLARNKVNINIISRTGLIFSVDSFKEAFSFSF